jgi:hypothetical protein
MAEELNRDTDWQQQQVSAFMETAKCFGLQDGI